MKIRVLSKAEDTIEPLALHWVIALLWTDRDHEQKLVLPRHLHFSSRGQYRCALKLPNPHQTYDLLCFWRLFFPQEKQRSFYLRLWALKFFSPNSTLLCWYHLLVVRFPQVFVPLNWTSKDSAHEVHLNGPTLSFSFPNSSIVPGASWEFRGVSRRSVQSHFSSFL